MDLNLARTFARVVEAESFTVAARALGLPKSSVSRAVARLEAELGARLLERTSRQLKLTVTGRSYYDGAARALAALADAEQAVAESQGEPRGPVRLTVPNGVDKRFLSDVVSSFAVQYPAIKIQVSFTNRIVDLVGEGFDLAIRGSRRHLQDSSLVARRVANLSAWLWAAPAYLKGRRMPRRPEDLKKHQCIVFGTAGDSATWDLVGPRGMEPVTIDGSLYSDDPLFIRELVFRGAGVALLPRPDDVPTSDLVRVLPDYEVPGLSVYVVVPSTQHLPRRVALFRQALIDAFKASPWALNASQTIVPHAEAENGDAESTTHKAPDTSRVRGLERTA